MEEKIVEELKNQIYYLGKKIADFETIVIQIEQKLRDEYKQQKYVIENQIKLCVDLSQKNCDEQAEITKKVDFLFDSIHFNNSLFTNKIDEMGKEFSQKSASHNELIRSSQASNSASLSSQKQIAEDLRSSCQSLSKRFGDIEGSVSQQSSEIKSLKIKIENDSIHADFSKFKDKAAQILDQVFPNLDSLKKAHETFSRSISDNLEGVRQDLVSQIEKRISLIKIPDISDCILKKDLAAYEDKIKVSSLDSSNANLRSVNCEMQLQILTKKLDNLSLQLKQAEINKG